MAILSSFELLLSRIAAPPDPTTPLSSPFRRVVQGYFLTVSNLATNNSAVDFRLIFTINFTDVANVAALSDPNNAFFRSFVSNGSQVTSSNHVLVINKEPNNTVAAPGLAQSLLIAGDLIPLGSTTPSAQKFVSDPITIEIGQTFSIALLPNTGNSMVLNAANMAVRGYAEIEEVTNTGNKTMIISAEHRGTFLDNNYPSFNNEPMDFDQIAYALPMYGGGSRVTI